MRTVPTHAGSRIRRPSHRQRAGVVEILLSVAWGLGCLVPGLTAAPTHLERGQPEEVGLRSEDLQRIDPLIEQGLEAGRMPGCVIAIGRHGKLVFLKAYGNRRLEPDVEPMTTDTVFDLASLTKPVATATSAMMLVQRGQLRLRDRVSEYWPEFGTAGKDEITIRQLMTHHSGLIADNPIADFDEGREQAMARICALQNAVEPGERFIYSDVGFIVLAEVIRRITGQDVEEFTQENLFGPLGMSETGYLPEEALRQRAAPTEQREQRWMQGEVHDPRAYRLGGIAGHAGLFSTAEDLAVYAQMMLQQGCYQGIRILSPSAIQTMTKAYDVSGEQRGLGWDKQSRYSSNRAELFTEQAFGHGGFTGTVLWIDPGLDLFFIFLSNRVHPDGKGNVNSLAGRIATIAAGAVTEPSTASYPVDSPRPRREVQTGLDRLEQQGWRPLRGQRIGLITNHTGIDAQGRTNIERLRSAPEVNLVALFSPEHGLAGQLDQANIGDSTDPASGLRILSLYGETRKPTAEQLAQIDTLVFDIQDIGTRFYTYISTMGLAMQAAAEQGKRFVVLDRPNPINGTHVEGPVLDDGQQSFVGFHTLPVRHGMTVGELAHMFRAEMAWEVDLQVVPITGWQREQYFDETGLIWVDPSPNMRNLNQAILYPGIGLLETTNLSVGRGTDTPFERIGAPWLDAAQTEPRAARRRVARRSLHATGLHALVERLPGHLMPRNSDFDHRSRCGAAAGCRIRNRGSPAQDVSAAVEGGRLRSAPGRSDSARRRATRPAASRDPAVVHRRTAAVPPAASTVPVVLGVSSG